MFEALYILAVIGALCLIFGVIYPAVAILVYPIYRLLGGRDSFREYIRYI